MAGQAFRKFLPLFDRVLVERSAAETVTKGGIMLPEKSQGKVLQATVVAVGSGSKGKGGEIQPVSVKVGDKVLLPEYGGTKVVIDDKDYFLFRDGDILGKYVAACQSSAVPISTPPASWLFPDSSLSSRRAARGLRLLRQAAAPQLRDQESRSAPPPAPAAIPYIRGDSRCGAVLTCKLAAPERRLGLGGRQAGGGTSARPALPEPQPLSLAEAAAAAHPRRRGTAGQVETPGISCGSGLPGWEGMETRLLRSGLQFPPGLRHTCPASAMQIYIQQNIRADCSNIDKILEPPEGQDEGVWKYEHLRQFCLELNGLAVKLQSECHPDTCTQMTATEQWIFLCAAHKTPKECPAIDYTRHTLDGAACLLNSNKYFPSRVSIKESSVAKLGSVCRRIYRIFSHAYFHHRQIFDEYENETFLCHRFTKFVVKYNLMSKDNLIVPILEEEVQNSVSGESEA
ncbi:MOB-like protein phocein [Rhinolophus ferrumequinum]|nr:MOB-like protein phocein [Rhinolophus ferrumequinum]